MSGLEKATSSKVSLDEAHTLPKKDQRTSEEALEEEIDPETPPLPPTSQQSSYSIFSPRRKKWIVWLMALASWFSPASSFIYFPAITSLASSLGVSIAKVNVTVTSYLVVSAVAPAIIGRAADESGRRLVLIIMLGIYVLANIGLALQHSYAALLVLRMLQSAGISGVLYFTRLGKEEVG